jgi:hypothetical protein
MIDWVVVKTNVLLASTAIRSSRGIHKWSPNATLVIVPVCRHEASSLTAGCYGWTHVAGSKAM